MNNLCMTCVITLKNSAWIMISIAMICVTVIILALIKNKCLCHLCCKKREESKSSKKVTTVIYHSDSKELSANKDNTNCKEVTVTNYEEP